MKIIIVGCGKIGRSMVQSLTIEGHDVLVIDKDPTILNETTDMYDVMGVCGNAVDCDTLTEANDIDADIIVATTDSDEMNMLSEKIGFNCFMTSSIPENEASDTVKKYL